MGRKTLACPSGHLPNSHLLYLPVILTVSPLSRHILSSISPLLYLQIQPKYLTIPSRAGLQPLLCITLSGLSFFHQDFSYHLGRTSYSADAERIRTAPDPKQIYCSRKQK